MFIIINEFGGSNFISFIKVSYIEGVHNPVIIKLSEKSLLRVICSFSTKYSSNNRNELLKAKYLVLLFSYIYIPKLPE